MDIQQTASQITVYHYARQFEKNPLAVKVGGGCLCVFTDEQLAAHFVWEINQFINDRLNSYLDRGCVIAQTSTRDQ